MSYMVKNPGLMPGIESLTNGDIGKKRKMLAEMMNGCWLACHSPDQRTGQSFVADAIISNPPAFAHIHCAEALGIPLLMSFTMPWCATTAFPHPLVNISSSNAQSGIF
jgi:sterol 3beta-glucosyltransferase